jgi:tetratricopeptide (TPR) repeat protein
MKNLIIISLALFSGLAYSQEEKEDKYYKEACDCISEIDNRFEEEEKFEEVKSCIQSALMAKQIQEKLFNMLEKTKDTLDKVGDIKKVDSLVVKEDVNIVIDTNEGYQELERKLLDKCKSLKNLLNNAKESSEKSVSDNRKALEFYDKGLGHYREEDFDKALKFFKKATKEDKEFAFAWDMVGITQRRQGDYKEAVKSYKKSLKIDPRGKMPLQNLPIAYRLLEKFDKAADVYKDLIKFYPEDPEGYFGLGQCGIFQKDDDMAIDNMMIAFTKYNEINSPYKQDAEITLVSLYKEAKEKGTLENFLKFATKHKINFGQEEETKE